ncbi:MAG: hypothetical protein RID91_11165 [Azospirillaceae bacterium]
MTGPQLNLLVLRAANPRALAFFYGRFGLVFETERHGNGPEHEACVMEASVLEIYPHSADGARSAGTRIGFRVPSIEAATRGLDPETEIVQPPRASKWGRRCVVRDPEGHQVELVETA